MPGVKEESENEAEEMSHDSNDSNQSSASCDSSVEHSDSDDSSEMDEDECERRRNECIENLVDLERQFSLLKDQYVFYWIKIVTKIISQICSLT